ncbi:MAG: maleylpyruvate isomerase family mycothiol-dependent enzyme [Chloroflexi bacterium]|nr:MAG: maleylpyruvate isomerase family mycothiol-dependent enzyme [Chloroflexota bacterium]
MDHPSHVAALRRDGAAAVVAATTDGIDAPVPGCPGWTVADLCGHLAAIHHRVGTIVRDRLMDPPRELWGVEPPPPAERAGWLAEGHRALVAALEGADPQAPVWTWTGPRTMSFWARRMALETAVHRWDLESAAGGGEPIAPELAVDGIDELFEVFLAARREPLYGAEPWRFGGDGERLHLHATDAPGEWVLRFAGGDVAVTREHAKGEAALRGPASELLLVLYGRVAPGAGDAELLGNPEVLRLWTATARI